MGDHGIILRKLPCNFMLEIRAQIRDITSLLSKRFPLSRLDTGVKACQPQITIGAIFLGKIMGENTFDVVFNFQNVPHKKIAQLAVNMYKAYTSSNRVPSL